MSLQLERPLVFLDLETTGLDPETDRIVEIGLVRLAVDGLRETLVLRMDPGVDIPDQASRIHGIRTEEVRGLFGKPPFVRIAGSIVEFIGDGDLAGFNSLAFDLPLFLNECARHRVGFDPQGRRMVDCKLIFNAKETSWDRFLMGPRNLAAAVRHYCGRDLPGAHSAGVDAQATMDVLFRQMERYPDLPRDVQGLHEFCANAAQQLPARS